MAGKADPKAERKAERKAEQDAGSAGAPPGVPPPPDPNSWGEFFKRVFTRVARAAIEWFAHSLLVVAIFALIQAVHWVLVNALGVPETKEFFGKIPLAWLVDAADVFLFVGIGTVGVIACVRAYMGKH